MERTINGALAVHPNDVVLDGRVVFGDTQVTDENWFPIPHRYGDVIDVLCGRQGVDGVHLVFRLAELHRPARHDEVGLGQGLHHIRWRECMRPQLVGVDVDHHLPKLTAEGMRNLHALEPAHLVAHGVVADLIQFRLGQAFARDGGQYHGQIGGLTPKCERPVDVRWKVMDIVGLKIDDLIERRGGISPRVELYPYHTCPRHTPCLLVINVAGERQDAFDA